MQAFLLLLMLVLSSCAPVGNLHQALAIKAYSDDKDTQARFVERYDQKIDLLLKKVSLGEDFVKIYPNGKDLISEFGQPVLVDSYRENGQDKERWLYRYQTRYFDVPKVYFVLEKGKVVYWYSSGIQKNTS
ncbi:MAG: hypothetical protein HQL15_01605 [Candidatus Omnitrophica bacterium]|nr:hypothetical protein [Candidatus Omnitrophota bacterium]